MANESWVIGNLEYALETWNEKMTEIWQLISQSPESFKGGVIWNVAVNIHGGLKAVGYALLVLFFVVGVVKTCGSLTEIKKPEQALKLFIRFALAKGAISYGLDLMVELLKIVRGVIGKSFLKFCATVCLEGAIVVLACVIYTAFAGSPPHIDADASTISMVWQYVGELTFGMLVLVGTVKMADRVSHVMFGM